MMNPRLWKSFVPVLALVTVCALSGCRHGSDADSAQVRLIDAVPDPAGVSASVNDHLVWKHSDFAGSSGYQKINAGRYQMKLEAGSRAASQEVALDKGQHYTVVALPNPQAAALEVRVFDDESSSPVPDGKARLTIINAAGGGGVLDILANSIVAVPNLAAGRRAEPLLLKAGDYQIKANAADSIRTLAGPLPLHLEAGNRYTVVVMGGSANGYIIKAFAEG